MRTKMNRYDLSLWDVRKRPLYGRETESVQAATLAGGFMEGTWRTPPQPRRNKTRRSCPRRKVFLGFVHRLFGILDPVQADSALHSMDDLALTTFAVAQLYGALAGR